MYVHDLPTVDLNYTWLVPQVCLVIKKSISSLTHPLFTLLLDSWIFFYPAVSIINNNNDYNVNNIHINSIKKGKSGQSGDYQYS